MNQLTVTQDIFGGITINPESLPTSPNEAAALLEHELIAWQQQGFKLVWLTLSTDNSALIPIAISMGFIFHHCTDSQITLIKRLAANAFIPPDATHFVGAGAVVLSESNELLVVLEKYERRPGFYKLPGGLVNSGEHIADAVIREVYEETGVQTEFSALLCFAHLHRWQYDKSNLYFVCRLLPLTNAITIDETEIAQVKWMPLAEYLQSKHIGAFNKRIVEATLTTSGLKLSTIEGFNVEHSQFEVYLP